MDEVDNIIIETLKALNCFISEDVKSLKQFDDDLIVNSLSICLEKIIPSTKFPKRISNSTMALKLKIASNLAEQIKDLGFNDEIGYQTILYFNEFEIRKVLIFLIEKLPRDTENTTEIKEIGLISKLINELKDILKNNDEKVNFDQLNRGMYLKNGKLNVGSYGNSVPVKLRKLKINYSENTEFRNYNVRILPTVTKQCERSELIPSLLFDDCKFNKKNRSMLNCLKNIQKLDKDDVIPMIIEDVNEIIEESKEIKEVKVEQVPVVNTVQNLTEQLRIDEENYVKSRKIIENKQLVLLKLNETKEEKLKLLNNSLNELELKKKTNIILSDEENYDKLKQFVDKLKTKLIELSNQWNEIQSPLLDEYNELKNYNFEKEKNYREKNEKLINLKNNYEELLKDLKDKIEYEEKLIDKLNSNNKTTNRIIYTKNIMEIIGNIKKQNYEMQKILIDTREVQKDINNLSGQIDRSFTISDELIFTNAKKDEMSKSAYKLLVSLHQECNEIIKIISDIGFIDRECRNLQELQDVEITKDTITKLKRLNDDLELIKKENQTLLQSCKPSVK